VARSGYQGALSCRNGKCQNRRFPAPWSVVVDNGRDEELSERRLFPLKLIRAGHRSGRCTILGHVPIFHDALAEENSLGLRIRCSSPRWRMRLDGHCSTFFAKSAVMATAGDGADSKKTLPEMAAAARQSNVFLIMSRPRHDTRNVLVDFLLVLGSTQVGDHYALSCASNNR
jgi:hypothetical protein